MNKQLQATRGWADEGRGPKAVERGYTAALNLLYSLVTVGFLVQFYLGKGTIFAKNKWTTDVCLSSSGISGVDLQFVAFNCRGGTPIYWLFWYNLS